MLSTAVDSRQISDVRVTCPLQLLTGDLNTTGGGLHFYVVDHSPSAALAFSTDAVATKLSPHGLDVAAVFGQLAEFTARNESLSRLDLQFEHNMQELFYNFVYSGTPSLGSQPLKESPYTNYVGASVRSRDSRHDSCDKWDQYGVFPVYAKKN